MNTRNPNEQKKSFCGSSKEFYLKDNNKNAHWVGHAKLKPLDADDCFRIKKIADAIQTGNYI